jgi:4-diphosphocytidyl-2-C-methyl-D-erythritol kinase
MGLKALYELPAPAKINLFLHIIGRRTDGYHLLQSIFALIDWQDILHLERRQDSRIFRHDLGSQLPEDDLCVRAARALQKATGCHLGVDISIDKHVPWGAGMGGGSSDAATVLLGLNRLWQLGLTREQLLHIGVQLGADVPFFIGGHNAFVEGIGEKLTPFELPDQSWAVIKPPTSVATPEIFSSDLVTRNTKPATVAGLLADLRHRPANVAEPFWGRNDLQTAAEALCPSVREAGLLLKERFGNSRMTGSGSAVFADASKYADAGSPPVVTELKGLPDGWVGRMCRSLPRHPLDLW